MSAPTEPRLSFFDRVADYVSAAMGRPKNILVWLILVVGWTLLFALGGSHLASGSFLPTWFTSQGYNFPLNLITTVAELFIGFLIGAASNRSERNLELTLSRIEDSEKKIGTVERTITRLVKENTKLTQEVHRLTTDLHGALIKK